MVLSPARIVLRPPGQPDRTNPAPHMLIDLQHRADHYFTDTARNFFPRCSR